MSVSAGKHPENYRTKTLFNIIPYMGQDHNLEALKYGTATVTTQERHFARKLHSITLVIENFVCK